MRLDWAFNTDAIKQSTHNVLFINGSRHIKITHRILNKYCTHRYYFVAASSKIYEIQYLIVILTSHLG